MGPSLKKIAARAGYSFQAVSQALNGTGALKDSTRTHILEVARRMGYRPNGFARAVRTGRFGNVGLLLSTVKLFSYLDDEFLDGVHDALAERNYHLTVAKLPDAELTSGERVPKLLRELAVDGLLVNYTHGIPQDMIELLKAHGVPSVWVNSRQRADCVFPDDAAAAEDATSRLLRLGHERVAFIDMFGRKTPDRHYSIEERRAGYRRAMRAAGLSPRVIGCDLARDDWISTWLDARARPTAVVTYSLALCVPVIVAAERRGLRVPEDLSVITFASGHAQRVGLEPTTVRHPWRRVGEQAVAMLERKIARPHKKRPSVPVSYEFVEGTTVAPPTEA